MRVFCSSEAWPYVRSALLRSGMSEGNITWVDGGVHDCTDFEVEDTDCLLDENLNDASSRWAGLVQDSMAEVVMEAVRSWYGS